MRSAAMDSPRGRLAFSFGLSALLLIAALASSCASLPSFFPPPPSSYPERPSVNPPKPQAEPAKPGPSSISAAALGLYRSPDEARAAPSKDELLVVDSAKQLVGQPPNAKVVVNGRTFTLDCIGTVCAIYYRLGIDLTKDFSNYSGNGVNCLFMSLKDKGVIHKDQYPRTGDVIFWDNTWDANGDGDRTNDPNTHAGIVLAVDDDGTIYYVHENMYKGVIIEYMNLLLPGVDWDASGKRLNSSLAIATVSGGPKPTHFLSGDVFKAFGDPLTVKSQY